MINYFLVLFISSLVIFILFLSSSFLTIFDSPEVWQLSFQDSASQSLTGITDLHNDIFFFLILILLGVFWILGAILYLFNYKKVNLVLRYWNHGTAIELIWTVTPNY